MFFIFRLKLSSALHADMDTDVYVHLDNYKSTMNRITNTTKRRNEEVSVLFIIGCCKFISTYKIKVNYLLYLKCHIVFFHLAL